jgi:hypothetical protein
MSYSRQRVDTVAGCFATLPVLLPFRRLQSLLGSELGAALATAACLLVLSALAFGLSQRAWARDKSYPMKVFNESFEVSGFLRDFAFFAWAELSLGLIVWCTFLYVAGTGSLFG